MFSTTGRIAIVFLCIFVICVDCKAISVSVKETEKFEIKKNEIIEKLTHQMQEVKESQNRLTQEVRHIEEVVKTLADNLTKIESKVNAIHGQWQNKKGKIQYFQEKIEAFANQIHHPVNLFSKCQVDQARCSVGGDSPYWKACRTNYKPLTVKVRYTD